MKNTAADVGPLLSSVSVMLAAFGVFYATQREQIEREIEDTSVPDDNDALSELCASVARNRSIAAVLAGAALLIWVLLLSEVVDRLGSAIEVHFSLHRYSTPDVVFFVAANAWLLLAIYIGTRWRKLRTRHGNLQKILEGRNA